ncbi:MAG: hypothetical protein LBF75_00605 [Treponema sp.]|nr:hypothetical protein [Treponema sp.]
MNTTDPVIVTGESGKKIKIEVERVTSGLYANEAIEFYAVPWALINSNDQLTASDWFLSQFTRIGEIAKANLEGNDATKRTITGTVSSAGGYAVIAILKNGDTRIQITLSYYYDDYNSDRSWNSESVSVPN